MAEILEVVVQDKAEELGRRDGGFSGNKFPRNSLLFTPTHALPSTCELDAAWAAQNMCF